MRPRGHCRRRRNGGWVAVIFCALAGAACARAGSDSSMVTIHMAGKERRFADEAGAASELVARCTEQFESADGILRMAVSEHTIQELTSNETVVELWFAEPRAFVIGFNNRSVVAQRVLVPLTGELAGDVTTLFYGSGRSWAAGPLRNRRGTAAIAELAEALLAGE